jgi:hypothetical protein
VVDLHEVGRKVVGLLRGVPGRALCASCLSSLIQESAHQVVDLWPGAGGLFVAKPLHPSFRDDAGLRANWNTWLPQIHPHVVTPDPGVTPDTTPYAGSTFKKPLVGNVDRLAAFDVAGAGDGPIRAPRQSSTLRVGHRLLG